MLCSNDRENINHLFQTCPKSLLVWRTIEEKAHFTIDIQICISDGFWIEILSMDKKISKASVIAFSNLAIMENQV